RGVEPVVRGDRGVRGGLDRAVRGAQQAVRGAQAEFLHRSAVSADRAGLGAGEGLSQVRVEVLTGSSGPLLLPNSKAGYRCQPFSRLRENRSNIPSPACGRIGQVSLLPLAGEGARRADEGASAASCS